VIHFLLCVGGFERREAGEGEKKEREEEEMRIVERCMRSTKRKREKKEKGRQKILQNFVFSFRKPKSCDFT